MKYNIPDMEPYIGTEEIENLKIAIKTKWISEGPFCKEFLSIVKEMTGAKYAVFAPNGTLSIYLGLLALGVGPGDEVIIPDFTFYASASPVYFLGAKPVFVDVEEGTLNIDADKIEEKITDETKAIMPVHIFGQSANMDPIYDIALDYDLKILEDAAESFGVFYKSDHTGTYGDIGSFSFFTDKTVTCCEGGVVVTNEKKLYTKLVRLRNQGRDKSGTYIHPHHGMNFHMTDIQCAVGVAQLKKFEEIKQKRLDNYYLFRELLEDYPVTFLEEPDYTNLVPFRTPIRVEKRNKVIRHLERNKIKTRLFFHPLHLQPCFKYLRYRKDDFPVTNKAYKHGIRLPVHPSLKQEEIEFICKKIIEVVK